MVVAVVVALVMVVPIAGVDIIVTSTLCSAVDGVSFGNMDVERALVVALCNVTAVVSTGSCTLSIDGVAVYLLVLPNASGSPIVSDRLLDAVLLTS